MSPAQLFVIDPGVATTLQDLGRIGYQRYGVPIAGALDRDALRLANALAGAPLDAAALEIRYLGPTLRAEAAPVRLALVGATVEMRLSRADGSEERIAAGRSLTLAPGETLRVGPTRGASSTAYLAVSGGVEAPETLGSRSTFARSRLGGIDGRALAAGDRLTAGAAAPADAERALADPAEPGWRGIARVVLGPQADHFTDAALARFLETDWRVTQDADRMGLRLAAPQTSAQDGGSQAFEDGRLAHRAGHDITSDGIVSGAIQVPGSGLPIVLLADRQTSGGYPKIAAVISADLPALGRLRPGDRIRFAAVSPADGAAALRDAEARLAAAIAAIGPWRPGPGLDLEALYRENLISAPIFDP